MFDLSEYKGAFVTDVGEMMHKARAAIAELRRDPSLPEQIHEVMRIFHNVKGTSEMMGLTGMSQACAAIEKLFWGFVERKEPVPVSALDQAETTAKTVEEGIAAL